MFRRDEEPDEYVNETSNWKMENEIRKADGSAVAVAMVVVVMLVFSPDVEKPKMANIAEMRVGRNHMQNMNMNGRKADIGKPLLVPLRNLYIVNISS